MIIALNKKTIKMKTTFFTFVFTLFVCLTFAQSGTYSKLPSPKSGNDKIIEERSKEITAGMAKHLRLTPEQTQKLYAINLNSMLNAEEAKVKYKTDPREVLKQIDIINQTRLSKIKDILTPVQFQQYQQHREEKMGVPKEAQSNPRQ
jgi:Spy/CpxP family protein refolding chaperone